MALSEKLNTNQAPRAWHGDIPVRFLYTAGVAGERFFREIKDNGRIFGTRCPGCQMVYVPARLYCERCFAELSQWVDVGTEGEVISFTVCHVGLEGRPLPKPQVAALIRLGDGALLHLLGEVDPGKVSIGMRVKAVFKPARDRQGRITDILHFKPV